MSSLYRAKLVALANEVYSRPETDPESTDPGVHPATYGTEHFGTYRAAMPHLSERDAPAYWDVEDQVIAAIDGDLMVSEADLSLDEPQQLVDEDDVHLSKADRRILAQHENLVYARGTAYAMKKSGATPESVHADATVVRLSDAVEREIEKHVRSSERPRERQRIAHIPAPAPQKKPKRATLSMSMARRTR